VDLESIHNKILYTVQNTHKKGRVIQSITQQLLVGGIYHIKQKLHVSANRGHHQVLSSGATETEYIE